jgi:hypothetical protein
VPVTRAFERQYDEEAHLFDVVGPQFRQTGDLDAYGFFFIVRWKANRAIGKIARRLIQVSGSDLEKAAAELGRDVFRAKDACERFRIVSTKWRMRLPMASAILTVLYPDEFTVYDSRVCKELDQFHDLHLRHNVGDRWSGYLEFKAAVERSTPAGLSLRDKDRYLWARSRHKALEHGIATCFRRENGAAEQGDEADER